MRNSRYIVEIEHRYTPSSSRQAHTCAGARSQYSSERSSVNTCWRSASVSVLGGDGRGRGGPSTGGVTRRELVVLVDDGGLVLGSERPPTRPGSRIRFVHTPIVTGTR